MALTYDPHDPGYLRSGVPFELLARIRREQPVVPTPSGAWYVARHADVLGVLKDVDTFYADLGPMTGVGGREEVPQDQRFLSEIDEPRHGRVRRLFNASFGPHRTREVAGFVRRTCQELVAAMAATEVADLHSEYAMPIPSLVMAHVLGLPAEVAPHFMDWSLDGSLLQRPCSPGVAPGGPTVQAYFAERLAEQRALPEPTNAVFATFIHAEVDGRALSDQEIVTELHFMIQAGVHTTRGLLSHVAQRLVLDPEMFSALKEDRSLVAPFVEESLRHDSPVQRVTRRCARPAQVAGASLEEGAWLEVGIASANRDEDLYDQADAFRLDRPDPRGHLAFGAGAHVCPGATLARVEAVTAIEVLVDQVDQLRAVPGADYPPMPANLSHQPVPAMVVLGA